MDGSHGSLKSAIIKGMQKTSQTMNPYFSVVIPTYNAEKFIERAVGSLTCQAFEDFEVVVVDDASADSTAHILQRLAEDDQRVRYFIQSRNKGTLAARARGVAETKDNYILLMDQDDELTADALEKLYPLVEKANADIVHFGVKVVPENEGAKGAAKGSEVWLNPTPRELFGEDILKMQFCEDGNFDFMVHHKAFRAELAKKAWPVFSCEHICAADDFLMSFILCTYAQSYVALADSKYYVYHLGAGETYSDDYDFHDWKRICDIEAKAFALIKDFVKKAESKVARHDWDERVFDCQEKLIEHIMNEMHDKLPVSEANRCIDYALQSWNADAVAGELWRFVRDRAYDDLVNNNSPNKDVILKTLVNQAKHAECCAEKSSNKRYFQMKEIAKVHLGDLKGKCQVAERPSPKGRGCSPLAKFLSAFRKG